MYGYIDQNKGPAIESMKEVSSILKISLPTPYLFFTHLKSNFTTLNSKNLKQSSGYAYRTFFSVNFTLKKSSVQHRGFKLSKRSARVYRTFILRGIKGNSGGEKEKRGVGKENFCIFLRSSITHLYGVLIYKGVSFYTLDIFACPEVRRVLKGCKI
jgi:hypothetical protein